MTYHNPTHTPACPGQTAHHRGSGGNHAHSILLKTAAAVLLLLLAASLFCGTAAASQGPFPDTGVLKSTTYTLTEDVTLSKDLSVPGGVSCMIDLNGYVLKGTGSGSVITVDSGGNLTLEDSSAEKTGKVTGGRAEFGGGVSIRDNSLFTLNGGRISGNTAGYGGGVFAYYSTFKMNGGYVEENNAETGAGGVCVRDGPFIMEGGYITGNYAPFCGGVYIHSASTFTMDDGYITGNRADEIGGGGVLITDASFVMNGGVISQNSAKYGGGVFADAASCVLSGGTISENSAEYGGGVYAFSNSTLSMSKGTITQNIVSCEQALGAGVYIQDTRFTMEGGSITENIANGSDTAGGGVFVYKDGTFTMTGGSITENSAGNGGVYVASGAVFEISGDVRIVGNYAGLSDKTTDRVPKNVVLESDTVLVLTGKLNGEILISNVDEEQPFEGGKFGLRREAAGADDAKQIKSDDRKLCGWFDQESDHDSLKWAVDTAAETPASPVRAAGIIAGLGAAAVLFGLRRK